MLIIGIAGGTGCGKTTVVDAILDEISIDDVEVISQDSYYKNTAHLSHEERVNINFDHPSAIDFQLLISHISALKNGESINQPVYSFVKHNRTGETRVKKPKKVLIIEGILVLSNPGIRTLLDIKLFVQVDSDERLIRRIKRDISERGRTLEEVLTRYQTTLKPMHEQFIEPMKAHADLIIPNNRYNAVAIKLLKTIITERL